MTDRQWEDYLVYLEKKSKEDGVDYMKLYP